MSRYVAGDDGGVKGPHSAACADALVAGCCVMLATRPSTELTVPFIWSLVCRVIWYRSAVSAPGAPPGLAGTSTASCARAGSAATSACSGDDAQPAETRSN